MRCLLTFRANLFSRKYRGDLSSHSWGFDNSPTRRYDHWSVWMGQPIHGLFIIPGPSHFLYRAFWDRPFTTLGPFYPAQVFIEHLVRYHYELQCRVQRVTRKTKNKKKKRKRLPTIWKKIHKNRGVKIFWKLFKKPLFLKFFKDFQNLEKFLMPWELKFFWEPMKRVKINRWRDFALLFVRYFTLLRTFFSLFHIPPRLETENFLNASERRREKKKKENTESLQDFFFRAILDSYLGWEIICRKSMVKRKEWRVDKSLGSSIRERLRA